MCVRLRIQDMAVERGQGPRIHLGISTNSGTPLVCLHFTTVLEGSLLLGNP